MKVVALLGQRRGASSATHSSLGVSADFPAPVTFRLPFSECAYFPAPVHNADQSFAIVRLLHCIRGRVSLGCGALSALYDGSKAGADGYRGKSLHTLSSRAVLVTKWADISYVYENYFFQAQQSHQAVASEAKPELYQGEGGEEGKEVKEEG